MKRLVILAIAIFFILALLNSKGNAQVVVKVKPVPPKINMINPKKPGTDFVLIPGHWIWHRPSKMYAWVGPSWVPKKENKKWVPGHWKKLPKGWKWIPGHWERIYKKRYFLK